MLPNVTVSVTNTHAWNEAQISSRTQLRWSVTRLKHLEDQSHAWHDILISTQLFITHLITTFLSAIITTFFEYTWRVDSSNKMSMLSPSIRSNYLSGQTERENMLILFLGTTSHISYDHRDDHRLRMLRLNDWPRVGCTQCYQACDGRTNCLRFASDHCSRARDAEMI